MVTRVVQLWTTNAQVGLDSNPSGEGKTSWETGIQIINRQLTKMQRVPKMSIAFVGHPFLFTSVVRPL